MQRARLVTRRYREERVEMVRQYVGQHWSDEGSNQPVPVNLVSLYISVVARNLIAKNPRVMLSTFDQSIKPLVTAMQSWANKEIKTMNLQNTLQRVVIDALFSVGICKVALATPAESASMAWALGAGQPFAERVDLDDFVFDTHARDFSEVTFIGHRYRVPLDVVRESRLYNKSRKDLTASNDEPFNQEGDERIKQLGQQYVTGFTEEFEEHVDLWEVYLPRHRLVLTLSDDQLHGAAGQNLKDALRVQNWLGPDKGPYHILAYGVVPGNIMPKGPVQDLVDLHRATNNVMRKIIRTAERMKEITAVRGGASEDGSRILTASDGDMIKVDDPQNIQQLVLSGQTLQHLGGVFLTLFDKFSYMAGNLDMMGGLSPQSKTLGQDQLLAQNASRAVSDMQDRTVDYTADVIRALCWYWHHDPFKVQRSKHQVQGLPGISIPRQVTPAQRGKVRFEELEIETDPYSMQHATPQSRMAAMQQIVTQIVIPMMQILQQSGITFDANAYLQKIGQYLDMPDLEEILTIQAPPPPDSQTGGGGSGPGMPQETTRNYVRENRSSQTRESSDRNMAATMMGHDLGGNPQKNGSPMGMGMK